MEPAEKCKAAWLNASTDTERFAALFVILKLLKSSDITDAERREVFETVGFSFLQRLLQSNVPERCPPNILKAVALAVLSCFTLDLGLASDSRMSSFIIPLKRILDENTTAPEDEPLVTDALGTFLCMADNEQHRKLMVDNGVFETLAKLYCTGGHECSHALHVLMLLVSQTEIQLTGSNKKTFGNVVNKMCDEFHAENSERKFVLCEHILILLLKYPAFRLSDSAAVVARESLTDILKSRLGQTERNLAIKLSSVLVDQFWSQWFFEDADNSKTYFIVLVQIICVEVRMLLEEKTVHDLFGDAFLLTACYRILESIISTMVGENWFQSNRGYASQLLNSLKMAMAAVVDFLKRLSADYHTMNFKSSVNSEKFTSEQIMLATIRVLCSWLAEETFVLQEEVCEILPFVLHVCEEWFEQTYACAIYPELDPLRFMVPPLCHLTSDDNSRKVLLDNNALNLLLRYMDLSWQKFEVNQTADIENLLTTMCGIFLNIVVFESNVVAENDDFFSFLKLLINGLSNLSPNFEHLTLKANFAVLGLLITNMCHKKVKSCETSFYRFLSASVKFLWDAHHVEVENDISRFVVTRQYREVWDDIVELWFIGMQALAVLLPIMPWIGRFLSESGWPTVIVTALSEVNLNGIEESIKCTYQALLCPLVTVSTDVAESFIKCDAIAVCRKHKLQELEELLLRHANQK